MSDKYKITKSTIKIDERIPGAYPTLIQSQTQMIVEEIDKYCMQKCIDLDIDPNVLILQMQEIYRLNALLEKYKWIPCSERLPEERVNPITNDYYIYPVTCDFDGVKDIRYYHFGNGHWHYGFEIMDDYVKAWMPLPELYAESEDNKHEV